MAIKEIVSFEEKKSTYQGETKVSKLLCFDDGEVIPLADRNKAYPFFKGPGKYDIEFGDYEGKAYIKSLKLISAQKQEVKAEMKGHKYGYSTGDEDSRQKHIALQTYSKIAVDLCIAQGSAQLDISTVLETARILFKHHFDFLANPNDFPTRYPTLKEAEAAAENISGDDITDEPPF